MSTSSQTQLAASMGISVRTLQRRAQAERKGNVITMPRKNLIKAGTYVAVADMHFPLVDWPTWNAVMDFIRRNKVAGFIDLGDCFDNACISPHNKHKVMLKPAGSYAKETKEFDKKILTPLEEALPDDAIKVMIEGNHTRWETDFVEEHPEFEGSIERFQALKLEERGWQVVPLGMHFQLGKLLCIHGDQIGGRYGAGLYPAKRAVEVYSKSVLQGHTHSPQSFCQTSPVDQTQKRMGFVSPILGTQNAHFMRNKPNAWANGFSIIEVRADGSFNVYLIVVIDGEFSYGAVTYGKKEKVAA